MHYATKLKRDIEKHERVVKAFGKRIRDFRVHLELPKFKGEGNDYINTEDVRNWLSHIDEASNMLME